MDIKKHVKVIRANLIKPERSWKVCLVIGHQSFTFDYFVRTYKEAAWYADQLVKALSKVEGKQR